MAFFPAKKIRGQVYDLVHLEPFKFAVPAKDGAICVRVEFGCHCFTCAWQDEHTPDLAYWHKGERRAFDAERYHLSKRLPDFIRDLVGKPVYWSNKGSFFFWRTPDKLTYVVFFTALASRKKGIDVWLRVESAYPKQRLTKYASPIEFSELMQTKAAGEAPEFGPRVSLKRK